MKNFFSKGEKYYPYIVIFLVPTYVIRFEFFGIKTNMLDVLLLVGIFLFLVRIFSSKELQYRFQCLIIKNKLFFFGVLLLFFGTFFSAFFSEGISSREWGIIKSWFFLPFLFTFLLFTFYKKEKEWKNFLYSYVLSAGAVSFSLLFLSFFDFGMTYDNRLRGWYDSPNQLALYIAPALLYLWQKIQKKISMRSSIFEKYGHHILFTIIISTLILTMSYGAFLSLLTALGVLSWVKNRKGLLICMHFFFLLLFCVVVFFFLTFEKEVVFFDMETRSSFVSRLMIWQSAWDITKDNFFWGIGPGNFQEKYLEYQNKYPFYLEWAVPHPHNIFLSFYMQSGFVGFIGFLCVLGSTLHSLTFSFERDKKNKELYLFVFSFLSMIVIWGFIDTPYWRNDISVVFWLVCFMGQDCKVVWRLCEHKKEMM